MLALPPENRLAMPRQSLHAPGIRSRTYSPARFGTFIARLLLLAGVGAASWYGISEMYAVMTGTITILQWVFLGLFAINFIWISFAACQAVLGSLLILKRDLFGRRDIHDQLPAIKTAILVPVYNEEPSRVAAAIAAMAKDLQKSAPDCFAFFILSDTNNEAAWIREEHAFAPLNIKSDPACPVYYRQRRHNTERKAGNISDWVMRWGGAYDAMLVLDADSIMTSDTIVELARRLEADPGLGLIQTLPLIVMAETLFGRLQQFANRLYGPIFANGLGAWHGVGSNFWGHNAIIRTETFASAAHLPVLSGNPPFGQHVISHDFIEAALLRRAGWGVRFDTDLKGTYEEAPPSVSDVLTRDRRWCQGNLQHVRFLFARGIALTSRIHILSGIMAYASAVFWLMLLAVGLVIAVQANFTRPEYFTVPSLFPTWPVFDSERAIELFVVSMAIVLLPKVLAWASAIFNPRRCLRYGGPILVTLSVLFEVLLSALMAPIMMLAQSQMVREILTGGDSGWQPQRRNDGSISFMAALRMHRWHTIIGIATASLTWYLHPGLFFWMLPVTAGLVLSSLLSWISGKRGPGKVLKVLGILRTPEEKKVPEIIQTVKNDTVVVPESPGHSPLLDLLGDKELRAWHIAQLQSEHADTATFYPNLILAQAKAKRVDCPKALEDWLTNSEVMALLHSPELIEAVGSRMPVRQ